MSLLRHPFTIDRQKGGVNKLAMSKEDSEVRRLVWHRRDLRLHDNELYSMIDPAGGKDGIVSTIPRTVSLFIFDNQYFEQKSSMVKGSGYKTIW